MAHDFKPGDVIWVDEFADPWGPTGRYGKSIPQRLALDRATLDRLWREVSDKNWDLLYRAEHGLRLYGNAFIKINTEGEKSTAKIDWKKPLRVYPLGKRNKDQKVYTFKSGKQRVVWIDDHVYPVDDDGRATAAVAYRGGPQVWCGEQIVENVPEENFFVGLARDPDGTYWLTDGGTMNYWKKLMGDQPNWIVDTRKPAEPPKAIAHDPKDWTVVIGWDTSTTSYGMRTEADARAMAEKHAGQSGDVKVVRVRETPAPADTARYIQLWRRKDSDGPWNINAFSGGRQEMTAAEVRQQSAYGNQYCAVKVRD